MVDKKGALKLAIAFIVIGALIMGMDLFFMNKFDSNLFLIYITAAGLLIVFGLYNLYKYLKIKMIEDAAREYYEKCKARGVKELIPDDVKRVLIEVAGQTKMPKDVSLADYYRLGRRSAKETLGTIDDENLLNKQANPAKAAATPVAPAAPAAEPQPQAATPYSNGVDYDDLSQYFSSDTEVLTSTNTYGMNFDK